MPISTGVDGAERLDDETIARVVAGLMAQHPQAPLATIGSDGRFCAPPAGFDRGEHPVVEAMSFLDLVRPQDRAGLMAAWANARVLGAARIVVECLDEPGVAKALHFLDTRSIYGTLVGILVDGDHAPLDDVEAGGVLLRPRICHMEKDEIGTITAIDDAAVRMLGWTREDSVNRRSLDFVHEVDHERAIDSWLEMAAGAGRSSRWRGLYRRADGEWMWIETTNINRLDGDRPHVLSELVDISEEMAAHEALRGNEEFLRRLTGALPVGVAEFETDGSLSYANERLTALFGVGVAHRSDIEKLVAADERPSLAAAFDRAVVDDAGTDIEVSIAPPGTEPATLSLTMRPSGDGRMIMCVADVTERARLRRELEVLATFDELTGCHNRASAMKLLENSLAEDSSRGMGTGVVFVDLDDFKVVNDRYGHAVGDGLLRAVAARLLQCSRAAGDIVGRFGGDEFLVIFPGLRGRSDLEFLTRRVVAMLAGSVDVDGIELPLASSVGAAVSEPGWTLEHLVTEADAAMYDEKRRHHRRRPLNITPG